MRVREVDDGIFKYIKNNQETGFDPGGDQRIN
jgi:hypothetical protein